MPKLNGIFCRLALLLILAGCKQDSPKPIDPVKEEPTILDSVNMLFKDVYLWNNLIDQSWTQMLLRTEQIRKILFAAI